LVKQSHRSVCEVAFADTDASGFAYFTRIPAYVKKAEYALLRRLGFKFYESAVAGWLRVRVSCDYLKQVRFWNEWKVFMVFEKIGAR